MKKKKFLVGLLALSLSLTVGAVPVSKEVSAATASSQFQSLSLAKTYKSLNQKNPCITQRFSADPCGMEYNGRVYVYCTNDGDAVTGNVSDNVYGKITTINCMSSSDMVNWTDHGSIQAAGSNGAAKWAGNSWAPTACHKTINGKEKFFLYFANNANGIGVLTSDSPTGPWVDPIGKALISRSTPNCSSSAVTWLFDPAVLVDSDGTGYLYFGGGVPSGKSANPQTARVVKLGSDMTSIVGTPVTINAPYLFEDSGINKVGNTYYYSYCTNWSANGNGAPGNAKIAYMTSSSPMGPFTYRGTCLDNPGTFFGTTGNNHHSIVTLNNKSYILYHAEWLNKQMYGSQKGYRTTHVNEISIGNGYISNATGNLTGVSQVKSVDPYVENQMESMAWQGGIKVTGQGNTKVDMNAGDWVGISGVQFNGTASVSLKVASQNGCTIKVCTDSASGTALGYVTVPATGGTNSFKTVSVNTSNISGTKNLFFVSSGNCVVDSWQFSKTAQGGTTDTSSNPSTGTVQGTTVTLKDGWYYIKNINAQKYLQVANNSGKSTENVELRTGSGVDGQKWYLTNVGNGYVTLKSALGNFMLDVTGAKNTDGANIEIYNSHSGTAQQFMLKTSSTNGAYVVATKASNLTKVLDDYNFGKTDGTNVCQWSYGGYGNQQWVFEEIKTTSTPSTSTPSTSTPSTGGQTTPSTSSNLKLDYSINNWGSGYQVNFKISNNTSAKVNTWTLKLKKSDINITSSWNVNVTTSGEYYVITPVNWNASIEKGSSIEFGVIGSGSIGSTIGYTLS